VRFFEEHRKNMQRVPEPELMLDSEQVLAYARADFSAPHDHFVALFRERFGNRVSGRVLDLGCGPGDICRRFANAFPDCTLLGVDGSQPMLELGQTDTRDAGLGDRIEFHYGHLPETELAERFDIVISNSLLHHLDDPQVMWQSLRRYGKPGAQVFVMDLLRPASQDQAAALVATYAPDEPDILRYDFYHSLLAAWRPDEVNRQLQDQNLSRLEIEVVSDRHFIVHGKLP
jgi:ubiquinone/menaquinone biosynthesis C-methylase UbiE